MRLSASQIETFNLCPRKWWLSKVRKLKEGSPSGAQAFGTVLHAVCERYLRADDLGVDPKTGEAIDLYPEGWHVAQNKFGGIDGEITVPEQQLVKSLIAKAIEEGVLQRQPGRLVEQEFRVPVIEGVTIEGFIDLCYPHRVEDHKTSKSTRWLKSANALAENSQILIYAKVALSESDAPEITLRHNGYIKDAENPVVRKTEITVSRAHVEDFWDGTIIPTALDMARVKSEAENFEQAGEPESRAQACQAYGGCAFIRICSFRETPDMYEIRVSGKKLLDAKGEGSYSKESKEDRMALKDRLVQKAEGVTKGTTPPVLGDLPLPPWINPEDRPEANMGMGFKDTGEPCVIATARAKKNALPLPSMFDIEVTDKGTAIWVGKAGTPAEGMEGESWIRPPSQKPVEAQERSRPVPVEKPEPKAESEPKADEEQDEEEEEGEDESGDDFKKKGRGAGRPKKGFILIVNGVLCDSEPVKSGIKGLSLVQIFETIKEEMAAEAGVESYYDIDVFARRDALVRNGKAIADRFPSGALVWVEGVGPGQSDIKSFVEALSPHAARVVRGVA